MHSGQHVRVFSHITTPTNRGPELLPPEISAATAIATDIESHGVRDGGSFTRGVRFNNNNNNKSLYRRCIDLFPSLLRV